MACRCELMFLTWSCQQRVCKRSQHAVLLKVAAFSGSHSQMDGDPPCSQIIDPQDTADDVPAEVVKDQHLPYWFPFRIQNRRGFRGQAVGSSRLMLPIGVLLGYMVQIQNSLDRSCCCQQTRMEVTRCSASNSPTWRSLRLW